MQERLQKLIARAGIASRRHAEALIQAGAVTVNGVVVTELGSKADPERDHIKVNGKLLRFQARPVYLLLNKPVGCVSTLSDPEGRRTLRDFLHGVSGRVYPVGRLPYRAEGLILLTNDGELAHRLMKISRRLVQTYWIKIKGALSPAEMHEIESFARARFEPLPGRGRGENPWYSVTLTESRGELLDAKLARMGHPIEKMKRVQLANLRINDLAPGELHPLSRDELKNLQAVVRSALWEPPPARGKRRGISLRQELNQGRRPRGEDSQNARSRRPISSRLTGS